MDKLKMHTQNKAEQNWEKLVDLFPNAVTETIDENGVVIRAIDKDILMQEINTCVVEGREERYQFTWPDKKKSILLANAPISKTLRPVREDSVNFDSTENLYIEGDNLDVLKLLQETYLGNVKMIYIDPPYNTGNDFLYEDDFTKSRAEYLENSGQYDDEGNRLFKNLDANGRFHTDWLNMMYPRLKLARNLLDEDGVIFISIDDNENENLKKICNEIFGEKNYVTTFSVENNPKGRKNNAFVSEGYEYCLVYIKNIVTVRENMSKQKPVLKKFFSGLSTSNEKDNRIIFKDEYGSFKQSKRQVSGTNKSNKLASESKDERCFSIYYSQAKDKLIFLDEYNRELDEWYISKSGETLLKEGYKRYISVNSVSGRPSIPLYSKSTLAQRFEEHRLYFKTDGTIYEKERDNLQQITSFLPNKRFGLDLMTESATTNMERLFGRSGVFTSSKSVDFIKAMTILHPDKDAIILDFFAGSSTTAHAVMDLNCEDGGHRKFIMVQLPEETDENREAYKAGYKNICEIGKERIRRAGSKIKEENPLTTQDLDIGFRALKLDSSNMKDVYYSPDDYDVNLFDSLTNNIKEDRTAEDLLFQVMLDLGVLLSSKIEESVIADKKVFNVENGYLIACFDEDVTDETIKAIAQMKPYYFVMRDSSLANDSVATNFEQIFATYSPDTIRKVI